MKWKPPGGQSNKNLLRQAQKLQEALAKAQEELDEATVEASAGGGAVRAVATGKQTLKSIAIDPSAVDPADIEMLQDLVLAAANEALEKSRAMANERLGALTGGLNIPGLT